jgi:uncharacterized repeat protein (TIGR02543 family)
MNKKRTAAIVIALTLVLTSAFAFTASAIVDENGDIISEDGFTYTIVNSKKDVSYAERFYGAGAYITGYGGGKSATVPAKLGGKPVISIELTPEGSEYFGIPGVEDFERGDLISLSVTACTELVYLDCTANNLSKLDVSKNRKLEILLCGINKLSEIDVSENSKLYGLICFDNKLSKLDVSENRELYGLVCGDNKLSKLDVSKNIKLVGLNFDNNNLSKIDISKNRKLEALFCSGNKLRKLDVSKNTKLQMLVCNNNYLRKIDISKNTKITSEFQCAHNLITDKKLLAKFTKKFEKEYVLPQDYAFTFKPNGGKISGKTSSVIRKKARTAKISKFPKVKRAGYKFRGWYTKKSGGKKVYKSMKVTGSKTYYAHWKKK